MHTYRDVSLKDSLYEYDLLIYDAMEPRLLQLPTWKFLGNVPSLVLGKVKSENVSILSPAVLEISRKTWGVDENNPPATNRVTRSVDFDIESTNMK